MYLSACTAGAASTSESRGIVGDVSHLAGGDQRAASAQKCTAARWCEFMTVLPQWCSTHHALCIATWPCPWPGQMIRTLGQPQSPAHLLVWKNHRSTNSGRADRQARALVRDGSESASWYARFEDACPALPAESSHLNPHRGKTPEAQHYIGHSSLWCKRCQHAACSTAQHISAHEQYSSTQGPRLFIQTLALTAVRQGQEAH